MYNEIKEKKEYGAPEAAIVTAADVIATSFDDDNTLKWDVVGASSISDNVCVDGYKLD